jgi:outer membrane lipoprotein-sorting protein
MNSFHRFFLFVLISPFSLFPFLIPVGNDVFLAGERSLKLGNECPTCAVNLFGVTQAKSNPASEKAEEILQKSLLAYGGESKILSLTDGSYEYQVESGGTSPTKPITVRTYFKGQEYFRTEASGDNLDAVTVLNGDQGWVKVGDTSLTISRKEINPMKSGMVVQLRPDILLLSFPKRRFTGQVEEDGRSLNQMEVSGFIEGEYVRGRLSLDAATNLIYKYEYEIERELPKGKGIVKGEERYLRYAEKEGFKYPAEVVSKQAQKTSRLKLLSVSFNSMLSDDLFQNPVPPVPEKK